MIDRVEIYVAERGRASCLEQANRHGYQSSEFSTDHSALRRRIGLALIELGVLLNPAALSRQPA